MLLGKLKISGHSMEPIIKNGSVVLVSSIVYIFNRPSVNDIVAIRFKTKILVKRIKKIKNGQYFLTGDNSDDSLDSRKIGLINRSDILGKVFKILK